MGLINLGSSHLPPRSSNSRRLSSAPEEVTQSRATVILGAPERAASALQDAPKLARLVADRRYFGLEAQALRAGAERTLARLSAQPPELGRIDAHSLGDDFELDAAESAVLLSALLAGGMLHPNGAGGYLPTRHFRQCALALVVAPLSRERARVLICRACALAQQINSEWVRNPLGIKTITVSGNYMSRRDQLSDLSLWLALGRRRDTRTPSVPASQSKDEAIRHILDAMNALSSFIVVRVVGEKNTIPRPFSVVFEVTQEAEESPAPTLERLRDWGASISRRLAAR